MFHKQGKMPSEVADMSIREKAVSFAFIDEKIENDKKEQKKTESKSASMKRSGGRRRR